MRFAILSYIYFIYFVLGDYCGENKIPSAIDVDDNGQISLYCSRPSCFKKNYSNCEERAFSKSCPSNTTWVGGITNYPPRMRKMEFTLNCCEFEQLPIVADLYEEEVIVKSGEYYEGKEKEDDYGINLVYFDLISDISKHFYHDDSVYYKLKILRFYCDRLVKAQKPKNKWPYFEEFNEIN